MKPRLAALRVLLALEASPARLDKLLHQELSKDPKAAARDKAQASALAYAVVRNRLYLDHLLAPFVSRPLNKLDGPVLSALRLGAADLAVQGSPAHAAVGETVSAAKATPAKRAQGMVNAVLQRFSRSWKEVPLPDRAEDAVARLTVEYSHPAWLVEELLAQLGESESEAWLKANQAEPPACLRANTLKTTPTELAALLASSGLESRSHPLCPDCLVLAERSGRLDSLPGFDEGLWQAQDAGAAALTMLLGAEPGMRVLDLCAGAGGKTGHLAALMQNQGEVVAVEPSAGRFKALAKNLKRLGATIAKPLQADGLNLPEGFGRFDLVLVDAPCTGLGTLGRRPDLRWRKTLKDASRLAKLQKDLLRAALSLTKPGGAVLYCTCTITAAENQNVVQAALAESPGLELAWLPGAGLDEDGYFRTRPHQDNSDAFFAARLRKREG